MPNETCVAGPGAGRTLGGMGPVRLPQNVLRLVVGAAVALSAGLLGAVPASASRGEQRGRLPGCLAVVRHHPHAGGARRRARAARHQPGGRRRQPDPAQRRRRDRDGRHRAPPGGLTASLAGRDGRRHRPGRCRCAVVPADPARWPAAAGRTALPVELTIPAIGVRTRLIRLGLTPAGSLQVPASTTVAGWYDGSPRPGMTGSSIIAGHIDSVAGPAVFFRLASLRPAPISATSSSTPPRPAGDVAAGRLPW
jgi:Sortase domain